MSQGCVCTHVEHESVLLSVLYPLQQGALHDHHELSEPARNQQPHHSGDGIDESSANGTHKAFEICPLRMLQSLQNLCS